MFEQINPLEEELLVEEMGEITPSLQPLIEGPLSSSPWVEGAFARTEWSPEAFFHVAERPAIDPILNEIRAFGGSAEAAYKSLSAQPYTEQLIDHPIFQGVVLLLALAYLLMLCANGQELLSLLGRKDPSVARPSSGGAIHTSAIIGIAMAAALLVRYAQGSAIEGYGTMTLLLLSLGVLIALPLLQATALLLVGRLTLSEGLIKGIIQLKVLGISIGSLLMMPFALLLILSPQGIGEVWRYAILLIGTGVLLLYLKETFQLFISKKVSILHWFLYLCAVELLPISFIVIKAIRW